ncbi:dna polymerase i [Cystoisospora suis]|uniref:Dna polymerase i n=1 Tax=Cystoisospora suis TaxID=483139 RepID=A0A2C6L8N8_9APIC|nr:dna polymerase i [Cystoisospora suis]
MASSHGFGNGRSPSLSSPFTPSSGSSSSSSYEYHLELRKNRFSGELGSIPYTFNKNSLTIREIPTSYMEVEEEVSRRLSELPPPIPSSSPFSSSSSFAWTTSSPLFLKEEDLPKDSLLEMRTPPSRKKRHKTPPKSGDPLLQDASRDPFSSSSDSSSFSSSSFQEIDEERRFSSSESPSDYREGVAVLAHALDEALQEKGRRRERRKTVSQAEEESQGCIVRDRDLLGESNPQRETKISLEVPEEEEREGEKKPPLKKENKRKKREETLDEENKSQGNGQREETEVDRGEEEEESHLASSLGTLSENKIEEKSLGNEKKNLEATPQSFKTSSSSITPGLSCSLSSTSPSTGLSSSSSSSLFSSSSSPSQTASKAPLAYLPYFSSTSSPFFSSSSSSSLASSASLSPSSSSSSPKGEISSSSSSSFSFSPSTPMPLLREIIKALPLVESVKTSGAYRTKESIYEDLRRIVEKHPGMKRIVDAVISSYHQKQEKKKKEKMKNKGKHDQEGKGKREGEKAEKEGHLLSGVYTPAGQRMMGRTTQEEKNLEAPERAKEGESSNERQNPSNSQEEDEEEEGPPVVRFVPLEKVLGPLSLEEREEQRIREEEEEQEEEKKRREEEKRGFGRNIEEVKREHDGLPTNTIDDDGGLLKEEKEKEKDRNEEEERKEGEEQGEKEEKKKKVGLSHLHNERCKLYVCEPLEPPTDYIPSHFILVDSPCKMRQLAPYLYRVLKTKIHPELSTPDVASTEHSSSRHLPVSGRDAERTSFPLQAEKKFISPRDTPVSRAPRTLSPQRQSNEEKKNRQEEEKEEEEEIRLSIGVDVETTGLDPYQSRVRLLQLALPDFPTLVFDLFSLPLSSPPLEVVRLFLRSPRIQKVFHNGKFDLQFLQELKEEEKQTSTIDNSGVQTPWSNTRDLSSSSPSSARKIEGHEEKARENSAEVREEEEKKMIKRSLRGRSVGLARDERDEEGQGEEKEESSPERKVEIGNTQNKHPDHPPSNDAPQKSPSSSFSSTPSSSSALSSDSSVTRVREEEEEKKMRSSSPQRSKEHENGHTEHLQVYVQGPVFDTLIAAKLIEAGKMLGIGGYKLLQVVERFLGVLMDKSMQASDWNKRRLSYRQLLYAARDAAVLVPLQARLQQKLETADLLQVFSIEMRCLRAVVAMELNGMQIDLPKWRELERNLRQEEEIAKRNLADKLNVDIHKVNFNSQKQMLDALRALGIPAPPSSSSSRRLSSSRRPFHPTPYSPVPYLHSGVYTPPSLHNSSPFYSPASEPQQEAKDTGEEEDGLLKDTSDGTLAKLSHYPAVQALRDYRRSTKAISAFVEKLPQHINPITEKDGEKDRDSEKEEEADEDEEPFDLFAFLHVCLWDPDVGVGNPFFCVGKIHCSLHQCGAGSGRFSCDSPNLQQIPREKRFRECFIPSLSSSSSFRDKGEEEEEEEERGGRRGTRGHRKRREKYKFVISDFSQIELRIAADLACDETMIKAYQKGEDLHRLTASLILEKSLDEIKKEDRQLAKAVNFGLIYGMSVERFRAYADTAYGIKMSFKEAQTFHRKYFSHYRGITRWHQTQKVEHPRETRTRAGRRALFDQFSFTKSLNYPVQGTSADITKESLARLQENLSRVDGKLVMCIHDEIIAEVPEHKAKEGLDLLVKTMEDSGNKFLRYVPCVADGAIADSWADKP